MPSERIHNNDHNSPTAEKSTADGICDAATSENTQEAVVLSQNDAESTSTHKSDNDIQAEIFRRREKLEEEEHDLNVSLKKAQIERAVLAQARAIIDARIRDLQSKV